jgi:hypothetical protein
MTILIINIAMFAFVTVVTSVYMATLLPLLSWLLTLSLILLPWFLKLQIIILLPLLLWLLVLPMPICCYGYANVPEGFLSAKIYYLALVRLSPDLRPVVRPLFMLRVVQYSALLK